MRFFYSDQAVVNQAVVSIPGTLSSIQASVSGALHSGKWKVESGTETGMGMGT
jgi:hypothetical protein